MQNTAMFYYIRVNLGFAQHHIRSRSAVKGEASVSVLIRFDESKRCAHILVEHKPVYISAGTLDDIFQSLPENIVSDLADKSSASAELI